MCPVWVERACGRAGAGECGERGRASSYGERCPPAARLFLDRTHFSAEKSRGACARRRWGCSWPRLRRRGRRRVLLVGPASSAGARVRPTPQESVATLNFTTKKLVVARPRLKEVSLPLPYRPPLSRGWLDRVFYSYNNKKKVSTALKPKTWLQARETQSENAVHRMSAWPYVPNWN